MGERILRIVPLQLRDEFLNGEIFYSIKELRVLAERWCIHYNIVRPHSSLGYKPPAPVKWMTATGKGHGEAETASRFPLLHTRYTNSSLGETTYYSLADNPNPAPKSTEPLTVTADLPT